MIFDYLDDILKARYGRDVRQSIHDAILECYNKVPILNYVQIVDDLPQTGSENTVYLVTRSDAGFEEYIWKDFEYIHLGTIGVTVDLTEYVKKEELGDILEEPLEHIRENKDRIDTLYERHYELKDKVDEMDSRDDDLEQQIVVNKNGIYSNSLEIDAVKEELQHISTATDFPKIITKTGLLVNLPGVSSEPIMGYGNAVVTIYANNVCSVDFDVKIYAKDGTETGSFAWGLNALLLSSEYRITPTTRQGIVRYFKSDGTVDEAHEGYAGWTGASGNCWTFGRVHKIAGDTGSWPVSSIPVGTRLNGRVFGTWVKI